jgi:hypothetical protein
MKREKPRRRAEAGAPRRGAPRASRPAWTGPWWLVPVLSVGASLVLHAKAILAPFFADDWLFLDVVRSRSLVGALLAPDPIGNFFRPLGRAIWFWLLAHLTHESPLAFHFANLLLWLGCVAMLWAIARRVAGAPAAAIASGIYALTYAADVPVRWAAGSQDLVATALALGATLLLVRGRRFVAALLFLLAPFAKESVALAVIPAAILARRAGESWRVTIARALPSFAATAAWLAIAALALARPHGGSALSFTPLAPVAALWGALRTLFGIEWSTGSTPRLSLLTPVVLAALFMVWAGIELAGRDAEGDADVRPAPTDVRLAAVLWWLAGALPVMLVAPIWSAYFFVWGTAGAALLAGSLLTAARVPRSAAALAVVALGVLSRRAGDLQEFGTKLDPFGPQSHVNDFYLSRGMNVISRGIDDLRQLHATVPPRSTFFFTGVPSFGGFQAGDGALVRGVYRDSSLRSYYLTDLTAERANRGLDWFVFYAPDDGHFHDETNDPELYVRIAMGQLLNGREDRAREALELARKRGRMSQTANYLAGFMAFDHGDRETAAQCFLAAGLRPGGGADAAIAQAKVRAAAGDSTAAETLLLRAVTENVYDVRIHATLADLQLQLPSERKGAALEAYAARVLAPKDPLAWKRWAVSLYWQSRYTQALDAIQHYFRMDPAGAAADRDAVNLRANLPRMLPGGDLYQRGLLKEANR